MSLLPSHPSESTRKLNPHLYGGMSERGIVGGLLLETKEPKRVRQDPKPLLNKLETEAFNMLCLKHGDPCVKPQSIKLKLANGTWYKPDFVVLSGAESGYLIVCYEVKGPYAYPGALEKLKIAAHQYPEIAFVLIWKHGGQFVTQRILP